MSDLAQTTAEVGVGFIVAMAFGTIGGGSLEAFAAGTTAVLCGMSLFLTVAIAIDDVGGESA